MYQKIIDLIIRVHADITLSERAKDHIVDLLETCTTEKEVIKMEALIDAYGLTTGQIIETALARKTPKELSDINHTMNSMVTDARHTIEKFLQTTDKDEARSIVLSF